MELARTQDAAKWAVVKLSRAYPASFVDTNTVAEKQRLYLELLESHPWITAETWKSAIPWLVWHHDGDYAPGPAQLLEACREQHRKEQQAATLALPAPQAQPSRPDSNAFSWNIAIGRARARKRFALIDAYRKANGLPQQAQVPESVWHGLDEPTEAEIRAVSGEALPAVMDAGGREWRPVVADEPSWPGAQRGTA